MRAWPTRFWPGPLTLIVPASSAIAADVTGGTGRVGVRVPDSLVARAICRAAGRPITATSANRSGQPATADPGEVERELGADVDLLIDAGMTPGGAPSTIVDVCGDQPVLVRAGAIPWDDIQTWLLGRHGTKGVVRRERAALVGLVAGRARRLDAERSLDELAGLADAAGADVVLRVLQERPKADPSTFLGSGKVETLAASAAEMGVDVVIFDNELTPAQLRQIEAQVGRKVVDRTQLILDIFARRARTREGKLQVELAQLKYLLPRLVGAGTALSRLGGGIGTRGPGETKLETDRRRIRTRIHVVSGDIDEVRQPPRPAPRAPAQGVGADRGTRRLHQRG